MECIRSYATQGLIRSGGSRAHQASGASLDPPDFLCYDWTGEREGGNPPKWELAIVNGYDLLKGIAMLRPRAGSLIQTILEHGSVEGPVIPLAAIDLTVHETDNVTVSLRTIVRAMEVLDDFTKTADYGSQVSSRTLHAYHLVERAVHGEYRSVGRLAKGEPGPTVEC